jgi:hypothetical protein
MSKIKHSTPCEQKLYNCVPFQQFIIISVGSGMGTREYQLNPQIVCVDPEPTSWQTNPDKLPTLKPRYKTVSHLIQDHKTTRDWIGNCIVCIFHPYPSPKGVAEQKMYGSAGYDREAITLLNPCYILLAVNRENSGSDALWQWIDNIDSCRKGYVKVVDFTGIRQDHETKRFHSIQYLLFVKQRKEGMTQMGYYLTKLKKQALLDCM